MTIYLDDRMLEEIEIARARVTWLRSQGEIHHNWDIVIFDNLEVGLYIDGRLHSNITQELESLESRRKNEYKHS